MNSFYITRRNLTGLAVATFAAPAVAQTKNKTLDFTNPADNVTAYAKMVGSTVKATTYLQYSGEIFTLVPGEVQKRIFRLKGLVKSAWRPNGDGTYAVGNWILPYLRITYMAF